MVKNSVMKFERTDSWVLVAVIHCGENGGTLSDIISVSDYINHAVLSCTELIGGLKRLIKTALVEEQKGRFKPTKIVLDIINKTAKQRMKFKKQMDDLDAFLESLKDNLWPKTYMKIKGMNKNSYEKALNDYLKK